MNQTLETPSKLAQVFQHGARGVVGSVDDLLELRLEGASDFSWQADHCRVRVLAESPKRVIEVLLPKSTFRAFIARVAAHCNEHRPNTVTPYGGHGLFTIPGDPPTVYEATFTNTPEEQHLSLIPKTSTRG